MATCWMSRSEKIPANIPRPEPYIESMAKRKFAFVISSRSAKLQIALTYADLRSTSSIAACCPFGIAPATTSDSMIFMMAGVADPPNVPLNFTPFQFQGLWLEVIITPPAARVCFTANETAGVGV